MDTTTIDIPDVTDTGRVIGDQADGNLLILDVASDLDAALRFEIAHHESVRFCEGVGWLWWDGKRWKTGGEARALELAMKSARRWTEEALRKSTAKDQSAVTRALTLEGCGHIKAAVTLAASMPRIRISHEQLDTDRWLLNVQNGTLDLRTGELRPHRRADFITKLAPVTFDPSAKCDALTKVLAACERHIGGMSEFLARCFGCALTGSAEVESLFVLQGNGGSGKTTLVEAMAAMLGDYAVKLQFESFCQSRHGRSGGAATPDLMPLRGARLAYASEGEKNARLDVGRVKMLTGNEPVTARSLYAEFITFDQTWKLWLVSNFDPNVDSDDTGMWRRVFKLQFAEVPPDQRDPEIKRTLTEEPAAWSALLNWALSGCLDWQKRGGGREGLAAPSAVVALTGEYRESQDPLADWWADLMTTARLDPTGFTSVTALRNHYEEWAAAEGAIPVGPKRLKEYLVSKKLTQGRATGGVRGWKGIAMNTSTTTRTRIAPESETPQS